MLFPRRERYPRVLVSMSEIHSPATDRFNEDKLGRVESLYEIHGATEESKTRACSELDGKICLRNFNHERGGGEASNCVLVEGGWEQDLRMRRRKVRDAHGLVTSCSH